MKNMLQVGGIYIGRNRRTYLGLYNYQDDIYSLAPPEIRGRELVAHFSYRRGGKKGGVNVFPLYPDDPDPANFMKVKKVFRINKKEVNVTENGQNSTLSQATINESGKKYSRKAELSRSLSPREQQEVLSLIDADIAYFCGNNVAKSNQESLVEIVQRIIPRTTLEWINPYKIITGGKQWFVPECCLEGNRDYGQGCITGWIPGPGSTFDGKTFVGWFSDPFGECDYCYAERKHRCPPKTVYKTDDEKEKAEILGNCRIDFEDAEIPHGKPISILRFGKRTEVWAPWSRDSFIRTLEILADVRSEGATTRGVITTKLIPFNQEILALLRKTETQILYSYGWDEHELGACSLGGTNEFRLEQAFKYREAGARSALYLMITAHLPPTERELQVLNRTDYGKKLRIQLLPMRFKTKALALSMTGDQWEVLKGNKQQLSLELGNYDAYISDRRELVVKRIHPFWLELIKRNSGHIRMCHHDDKMLYCGGCFQRGGMIHQERKKR